MPGARGRSALASDDWMLEQQVRAELEAEAWRRLREDLSAVSAAPARLPAPEPDFDHHSAGSTILKAVVRFALGAFAAYLAYLAAWDLGLGEIEIWLASGSAFLVMLAVSMFSVAREFVHMLAETARWAIITGVALGAVWLLVQMSA